MNPLLTEDHEIIRKTVRDFAEREIKPLAPRLDEEERFSPELTRKMGKLGLFGMTLPPKYGGHLLDTLSYIIAVEEIARVDGSQAATLAAHNSLGVAPFLTMVRKSKKRNICPASAPENICGHSDSRNPMQVPTAGAPVPPPAWKTGNG